MRIVTIDGHSAICDLGGVAREVNLFLLQDRPLEPGDHVLVHVGYALQKVEAGEANAVLELLKEVATRA